MFSLWYLVLGAKEYRRESPLRYTKTSPLPPAAHTVKPDVIPKASDPIPISNKSNGNHNVTPAPHPVTPELPRPVPPKASPANVPKPPTPSPPKESPPKPPAPSPRKESPPKPPAPSVPKESPLKPPAPSVPKESPSKPPTPSPPKESPPKPPLSPKQDLPLSPESPPKTPLSPKQDLPLSPESPPKIPLSPKQDLPLSPKSPPKPPLSPKQDLPLSPESPKPTLPNISPPIAPESQFNPPKTPEILKPKTFPQSREDELLGGPAGLRQPDKNRARVSPMDLSYEPSSNPLPRYKEKVVISNPDSLESSEAED